MALLAEAERWLAGGQPGGAEPLLRQVLAAAPRLRYSATRKTPRSQGFKGYAMSNSSHSPPGKPGVQQGYDPLVDPIPLPVVKERDTDTAWAEFDSLMSEIPPEEEPHPDFEETQPLDRNSLS